MTMTITIQKHNKKSVITPFNKGFQADRKKTNFEKDVDDLLFSGMAPAPRRRRGEEPAPPKPDSLNKPEKP